MQFKVDKPQRYAKMRAHTATHLLHAQLVKLLPHTKQAGSHVDQDYLRFDFQADKPLTPVQILDIEKNINKIIYQALPVQREETSIEEATKKWAKAFFEDKYGEVVRVVSIITEHEKEPISIELCGGAHVANTREIGAFKITTQEAVASGIKRIVAITGPQVTYRLLEEEKTMESLATKLWVTTKQFPAKLEKTLKELNELQEKYIWLQDKIINQNLKKLYKSAQSSWPFSKIIKISKDSPLANTNFKLITQHAKNLWNETILIYNQAGNFIITTGEWASAKSIAQDLKLKGGWNDTLVQGRDPNISKVVL